jgi:hypothetical protein
MKLLLYCDLPQLNNKAQTIIDHISSFEKYSEFDVHTVSSRLGLPYDLNLFSFDLVVIHYSLTLTTSSYYLESYIPLKDQRKLREYTGLKILFIQDEYRRVNHICDRINYMKIDVLFTCAPIEIARAIYERLSPKTKILETLTGYAPDITDVPLLKPHKCREIDVFYRARKLPLWYGSLALDKHHIAEKFLINSPRTMNVDISTFEEDRIYGEEWLKKLRNAKTTLGTESGASIIDYTGDIERDVAILKCYNPDLAFENLPKHIVSRDKCLSIQVISPRIFEAIACKTTLILFPGSYSGILKKNRHYLELEKDFSNFDWLLEKLNNKSTTEKIAATAYEEIIESGLYSYKAFIKDFDSLIRNALKERQSKIVQIKSQS